MCLLYVFLLLCNIPQGVRESVSTGRWAKLTPEARVMRPDLEKIQVTSLISAGADVNDVDEVSPHIWSDGLVYTTYLHAW